VSQANKKAKKIQDTSGQTLLELSKSASPLGLLEKTLVDTLNSVSTPYSKTWRVKVTTQGHLLFQLHPLVHGTKGKDSGLLATPNTMDHLPPRSPESTKKLQEGHRKGRTKPSNLREQVDPATMRMYPTPTTQEIEHPDMKLTENNRRLTKDGKNSHSLNLADTVKMYPTPTVGCEEGGEQSDRVELTPNGSFILRKKNKPDNTFGAKLSDAMLFLEKQKMYPTPTVDDGKNVNPKPNRRKGLVSTMMEQEKQKMYPTPAARDYKDSTLSPASMSRNSDSLPTMMMRQEQYPTPNTRDTRRGCNQKQLATEVDKAYPHAKKTGGKLNPNFVEFLMGFPMDWTKVESEESKD
jgi:hypothetical protein